MGRSADLKGPDLSKGIDADQISDGQKLLGFVGDEAVLLVRHEEEYFAVGATCSHYGGPLHEGLIVGETVHCPWHHACFDLRTGDALKAPALNPISAWNVELRGGKIYVTNKKASSIRSREWSESQRYVIVGAGAAGTAAAIMLRKHGFIGHISVVTEDKYLPYDRPNLSKDYLAGNAPEDWVSLEAEEFYQQNKIHFELSSRVEKIDSHRRSVFLSNGKTLRYDRALLATGGEPVKPKIPGIDKPQVHYLRTLQDCRRIIGRTSWAQKVVIIGAGFIGLEAAAALRQRNLEVHVVAPEEMPLLRVVGVHVGSVLRKLHEEHGVHFHLGHGVKEIRDRSVLLDSGESVECDFVIVGTGIRPNTALAEQAGCWVENGVLVNEYLETSVPGIFAAGDIARWPDPRSDRAIRVEHWEVAERQGQTAALNMMGDRVKFQDVPFFWTQHYDLSLGYVGYSDRFDRMDVMGDLDSRDFAVAFYEDQRVAAVLTVGRDLESLMVEDAFSHFDDHKLHEVLRSQDHHAPPS
ncbi:FAD-dependent oxidoreductase [Bdellovibrio sp.]|uniref:FAD-dependent oxidoreductase n=1 Tax=Bdellovibrio sp. TaxID=28201 RepID=UPI003221ACC8